MIFQPTRTALLAVKQIIWPVFWGFFLAQLTLSDNKCTTYEALSRCLAHSADLLSTWGPSAPAVAPMNVTCIGFPSMLAFLWNVKRKREAAGSRSSASNKQGHPASPPGRVRNQSFAPRHRSQGSGPAGAFCCISSTPSSLRFTVGQELNFYLAVGP